MKILAVVTPPFIYHWYSPVCQFVNWAPIFSFIYDASDFFIILPFTCNGFVPAPDENVISVLTC